MPLEPFALVVAPSDRASFLLHATPASPRSFNALAWRLVEINERIFLKTRRSLPYCPIESLRFLAMNRRGSRRKPSAALVKASCRMVVLIPEGGHDGHSC